MIGARTAAWAKSGERPIFVFPQEIITANYAQTSVVPFQDGTALVRTNGAGLFRNNLTGVFNVSEDVISITPEVAGWGVGLFFSVDPLQGYKVRYSVNHFDIRINGSFYSATDGGYLFKRPITIFPQEVDGYTEFSISAEDGENLFCWKFGSDAGVYYKGSDFTVKKTT